MLSIERYRHSLSVQQLARELACIHSADEAKASLAGLLHDCARCMSPAQLLHAATRYGIQLDNIEREQTVILHPIIGAELAADMFGVEDAEILNAIRSHATGHGCMSSLDTILYLADYAEPLREYKAAEYVRALAYEDLDQAMLEAMKQKIQYLLERKSLIHPRSIAARNSFIRRKTRILRL